MAKQNRRRDVIIDMNEFLITYAATILNPADNISADLYNVAKQDYTKIDDLLKDNGYGRKNKFYNIGVGFLRNSTPGISDDDLATEADKLAKEAIDYMGKNEQFFETWRTD
ncbi:hypothetical protein [Lentilactobacillus sp. Marseille-Q4993]|uniref:hypothetical protein n=1 Tax=Lentilactobacillus sp. Marseille-Q4993 TaxID=3039492 RepID=UPI0024BCC668|nr:hypothetical protein [Lentilactobacillus sp. Marseille-Q4993]